MIVLIGISVMSLVCGMILVMEGYDEYSKRKFYSGFVLLCISFCVQATILFYLLTSPK